jgi:FHS family L-fucose permease-like MFS transporter
MMLSGLVCTDTEIAKFFLSQEVYSYQSWPSIFDLAIAGLGKNTGKASSFLIMMILGRRYSIDPRKNLRYRSY